MTNSQQELKLKAHEQFNQHQQNLLGRIDSFTRAIFVLAGGALTISIGIFIGGKHAQLTECQELLLKYSWWSLFTAIIAGGLSIFFTIVRDYIIGERWRKLIYGNDVDATGTPGLFDIVIWIFGIIGLLSFFIGMVLLAYVSTSVINSYA